jgi:NAD(P)-dependent dehydrogenase (short-subunit alcohol dehydrogenase family)
LEDIDDRRNILGESNMKIFKDRVAFVTGGASGIGYGMVQNFLKEGMKAVVVDYTPSHCDEIRQIHSGDPSVLVIQADVSDRNQVRGASDEAVRVFGKINVLCNNAGVGGGGNAETPDFESWDKALSVNLGSVVNGVKIITPLIVGNGEGGHIVNTGSIASLVPNPLGGGAYMTAKAAVRGFTEGLRISIAPQGIGVSLLCPGSTRTRIMDEAKDKPETREMVKNFLENAMDPLEVGTKVVEGIRNNVPYIITHAEFRDEVREIYQMLDDLMPKDQEVPPARMAFEDSRRKIVRDAYKLPIKD